MKRLKIVGAGFGLALASIACAPGVDAISGILDANFEGGVDSIGDLLGDRDDDDNDASSLRTPSAEVQRTQVQQSNAGLLQITTTNAQQQIEVTIGPAPGEVQVNGVSGLGSNTDFTGVTAIQLTTGRAQDYVEFRILSTVVPSILLNTGLGNSDVKVIYQLPESPDSVDTMVTVNGNSANDIVNFLVESRAAAFAAQWTVNGGAGTNEILASVNSPEASDTLSINLNGTTTLGLDKLELAVIHNAAQVDLALTGSLGANQDFASLIVDGLGPAQTNTAMNLDLGTGLDAASIEIISRGGDASTSGQVRGGDSTDTVVFKQEGDGSVNVTLDGGNGNDLLDMFMKGLVEGTPRLLGGAGNDELKLVVDGPQIATPFIDGGPGFDIAIGFGTIVNVEDIN